MSRRLNFRFRCGDRELGASLPDGCLLNTAERRTFRSIDSPEFFLTERLASSDYARRTADIAASDGKALLICDDMTRPTPTAVILPVISDFLSKAGVDVSRQKVLFATGSHTPVTEEEARAKIGGRLWGRIPWASHRWDASVVRVGETASGIPVEVAPLLSQYKCIVGIGSVFPHRYCGWSGGGKIIVPGVSSPKTVSRTHWLPFSDPSIFLGSTNNMALREIMSAAKMAGLNFLVQCICDGEGNINDIFAGEPENTHREAVLKAREVMSVALPESDIVIAQAWPEESDLWQAGKALYAAENIVRGGGHIIVAAALKNGIGPHELYAELMNAPLEKILKYREAGGEDSLAAAAAFVTSLVRRKADISFVIPDGPLSGLSEICGLRIYNSLGSAVLPLLKHGGKMTVSVIEEAPLTLPLLEEGNGNV